MAEQGKKQFNKDAYLYIAGDENSDKVFIIEAGEVELRSSNEYMNRKRRVAQKGDIFGFITALSHRPRMESAISLGQSSIAELSKENFLALLQNNRELAVRVLNIFAGELRKYNEMIFSLSAGKDYSSDDTRLFELGKYYIDTKQYSNAYYVFTRYVALYPDKQAVKEAQEIIDKLERSQVDLKIEPLKQGNVLHYSDKQIIFCEHEPGEQLFLIKSGRVDIIKNRQGVDILLSVLKEGDIFGELAIASDKPRNATVISHGESELLPVDRETLFTLFENSPEIVNKILIAISQRLWFTYIRADLRIYKKPLTKIYVFLENKLLEERVSLQSEGSYTFDFGIDILFQMTDLSQEKVGDSMDELFRDQNLAFRFGQIIVFNIYQLSARAKFYRMKDNIAVADEYTMGKPGKEAKEKAPSKAQVQDKGRWRPVREEDLAEES